MAKKRISSLHVTLAATVSPFVKAFQNAGGTVDRFVGNIKNAGASVLKFAGIGGMLTGLLGGAGLAAGITQQLSAIDAAGKLADRLGMTTQSLTGMQHAATLGGVATATLTTGLETMLKNIGKAASGGDGLAGVLEGIGLNASALAGMGAEDAFLSIADALAGIENPAARALAATQIFGKAGQQLLPMMMQGADGIRAAMQEAERLGITFNRLDAAKIEGVNDAMARLKAVGVGAFRSLTIAIAPFLTDFLSRVTSLGTSIIATFKRFSPLIVSVVSQIGSFITSVWQRATEFIRPIVAGIASFIQQNWHAILTTTTGVLMGVWNVVSGVFTAVSGNVKSVVDSITSIWSSAFGSTISFSELLKGVAIALGAVASAYLVWKGVTLAVTAAQWLLNVAMLANPIGLVVVAIGGLVAWVVTATGKITSLTQVFDWLKHAMNVAAFAITNWKLTLKLAAVEAALFAVRTGNQIAHVFTVVIPELLRWFADNWRDIFTTIFNFTKSLFVNMYKNATGFFSGVWSWLKGDGFNFQWTGLLDGFESTLKELPQIAERQIGPLEQSLQDQAHALRGTFTEGLAEYLKEQQQAVNGTVNAITDAVDAAAGMLNAPSIDPPDIPAATMAIDIDTSGIEAVGQTAKASNAAINALLSGSAEAFRSRAADAFAARVSDRASVGPAGGPTNTAPLSHATQRDVRDVGKDKHAQLLNSIIAELKAQTSQLADLGRQLDFAPAGI